MKNDRKTKNEQVTELKSVRKKVKKLNTLLENRKHTQHEITEGKRLQEESEISEEHYRGAFETSHDGLLLVHRSQGDILNANAYAEKLLGYSKEEFLKNKLWGIGVVKDDKDFQEALSRLEKDGVVYYDNISMKNKAGLLLNTEVILVDKEKFIQCNIRDNSARRQAEEKLQESEERYRNLVELSSDPIFVHSEGKIVFVNSAALKLFGTKHPEEIIGKSALDFVHPDYREFALKRIQKIYSDGLPSTNAEEKFIRFDGTKIDVEVSSIPCTFSGRKAIQGVVRDITERKRAEEELKKSEERFKLIFEYAPDAFYLCDLKGDFIAGNKAAEKITGFEREELIGASFLKLNLLSLDQLPKAAALLAKNIVGKSTGPDEFILKRKDGDNVLVEISTHPVKFDKRTLVLGIARDITERKRVEKKIALLAHTLKSVTECVSVTDLNDIILFVNNAFLKTYGYTENEILGKNINIVRSPNSHPETAHGILAATLAGGWNGELMNQTKDGRDFPVSLSTSFVRNEQGQDIALVGIATDITDRKRAEEELKNSEDKYRSIFENVQDVYYETLLDGTILEVSPSIEVISKGQYHRADVIGRSMYEFYPDTNTRDTLIETIQKAGSVMDFEVRLKNRDDSFIPCSISAKMIFNAEGRPEKIIGSMHDISKRKQAEERLSRLNQQHELILSSAAEGILGIDSQGNHTFVNPAAAKMLGYEIEELLNRPSHSTWHHTNPDGSPYPKEECNIYAAYRDGKVQRSLTEVFWRKDGTSFPVEYTSTPIVEQDQLVGAVVTFSDITERKRAEEELKFKNIILSTQQEVSIDGILVIDEYAKILSCNHQFVKMWGIPLDIMETHSDELVMKSVMDKLEEPQRFIEQVNYLYAHRTETSMEEIVLTDGRILDRYSAPMIGSDAKYYGRVWYFRDITKRKRAEEALRETTDYLENLLSFANAPIMVWDNNNRITKFNLAFERLTKYTIYDVVGKHPEILFPAETREYFSALISRTSDGENLISVELPVRCKDGSVCIVLWNTANIYTADEKTIIATIAHGQDITKRKHAEEELSESETRYRSVLQSATDAIITADSRGIIVGWNSGAERIFGYNYTEAAGQSLTSLMPVYHHAAHTIGMERVLSGGDRHAIGKTVESEGLRKDKSVFPIELSLSTWESKSGQFFTGIIRDVTERKQAEELIQESELRFRSLYENATIGIYRTTPEGKILLANPALVKMLGYSSFEKLAEKNLEQDGFEPSFQRKEFLEKIEREGEVTEYDSKWIHQDGTAIFVLESARAIRDSQGKTLYYDGTVENVTNRKQLEEQMRQMQKLESLGTLAGGIAHDFNNILGIILAYATTINRMKTDPEKLEHAIDTISKAVQRGTTLVRQILTFARKSDVEFELLNINSVAKEVIDMILETFPRTMTYLQNLQKDIPFINADRSQIHQALLNLCVNARDAMPNGGVLTMNSNIVDGIMLHNRHPEALASQYICIVVGDTGIGMSEEIRNRIFEPFFTTKEKGKGTGLGLAVVFGVVKTHKGFVEVESEFGKGTTFRLYFPVPPAILPARQEIQDIVKEIPGGTETLLIVEDEETMMTFIQMSLAAKGYTVLSAIDGPEAVKIYRERYKEINLVFTDLGLPGMTGIEAINIIRKINSYARIIVATGYLDPETKSELLKAGVKKFILKPYDFEEILLIVREVLDEK